MGTSTFGRPSTAVKEGDGRVDVMTKDGGLCGALTLAALTSSGSTTGAAGLIRMTALRRPGILPSHVAAFAYVSAARNALYPPASGGTGTKPSMAASKRPRSLVNS